MMSTEPLMNEWTVSDLRRKLILPCVPRKTLVQGAPNNIKFKEILTVHCTFTVFASIHRNYYNITRRHYESTILEFTRVRAQYFLNSTSWLSTTRSTQCTLADKYINNVDWSKSLQPIKIRVVFTILKSCCSIMQYLISGRQVQLILLHCVKV